MRTALDAQAEALDPGDRAFVQAIKEHGWVRTGVSDDLEGPGFSFTTGFWSTLRQPELIVFSLNGDTAHQVFWTLFREAKDGRLLSANARNNTIFANSDAYAFSVARRQYARFMGWSRWFYGGEDFPCFQIVWPDDAGLFPWEPGSSPSFSKSQPDLTERGWLVELAH